MKKLFTPGLALGLALAAASSATAADSEFDRRLKIIDALEVTHNDAELMRLVAEDGEKENLYSYYTVLRRAANYLKSAELVTKLLEMPVLDQGSQQYKRTVGAVFSEIAANNSKTPVQITDLLYAKVKDDLVEKNHELRFIFSTAAMNMPELPNAELTKRLVRDGADVDAAFNAAMVEALSNTQESSQEARLRKLDRLNKFKNEVLKP